MTDDGCGIGDGVEGAGIRGMRERALLVGAELASARRRRGGTEVRLRVPVASGMARPVTPGSCSPTTTRSSAAGCG